jgi:hypothetical protein
VEPKLYFLRIALACLLGRPLQRPVHRTQNLPHVAGVIAHLGQSFDYRGDAGQRPQIRAKPVGAGTLQQRLLYLT